MNPVTVIGAVVSCELLKHYSALYKLGIFLCWLEEQFNVLFLVGGTFLATLCFCLEVSVIS